MNHDEFKKSIKHTFLNTVEGKLLWEELKERYLNIHVFGDIDSGELLDTDNALLREGKRHLILEFIDLMKE